MDNEGEHTNFVCDAENLKDTARDVELNALRNQRVLSALVVEECARDISSKPQKPRFIQQPSFFLLIPQKISFFLSGW